MQQAIDELELEPYMPFMFYGGWHKRDARRWPELKDFEEQDIQKMDRKVRVRTIGVN